jgi:hypothetical protein
VRALRAESSRWRGVTDAVPLTHSLTAGAGAAGAIARALPRERRSQAPRNSKRAQGGRHRRASTFPVVLFGSDDWLLLYIPALPWGSAPVLCPRGSAPWLPLLRDTIKGRVPYIRSTNMARSLSEQASTSYSKIFPSTHLVSARGPRLCLTRRNAGRVANNTCDNRRVAVTFQATPLWCPTTRPLLDQPELSEAMTADRLAASARPAPSSCAHKLSGLSLSLSLSRHRLSRRPRRPYIRSRLSTRSRRAAFALAGPAAASPSPRSASSATARASRAKPCRSCAQPQHLRAPTTSRRAQSLLLQRPAEAAAAAGGSGRRGQRPQQQRQRARARAHIARSSLPASAAARARTAQQQPRPRPPRSTVRSGEEVAGAGRRQQRGEQAIAAALRARRRERASRCEARHSAGSRAAPAASRPRAAAAAAASRRASCVEHWQESRLAAVS